MKTITGLIESEFDAKKFTEILLRAEVSFFVEKNEDGFVFTILVESEDSDYNA